MENDDQQIKHESASDEFLSGSLNYLDNIKDVKAPKRRRSVKPMLITLVVIAVVFGGFLALFDVSGRSNKEEVAAAVPAEIPLDSNSDNTQIQLNMCLGTAKTDVEIEDPEFFQKLIVSYQTQIDCYNQYDSDSPTKKSLEERLSSAKTAAQQAEANAAEYNRLAAPIDEEHRQYVATLDAKAARQDEETRRRLEQSDAEWAEQNAEWKAEQARREAELAANQAAIAKAEQEKVARCNAYKAKYGDKSAEELARTDAFVVQAYNKWQDWSQKAQNYDGPVLSQAQCQAAHSNRLWDTDWVCPSKSNYERKANEAKVYYDQLFAQKVQAYNSSRKLACEY